MPYMTTLCEIYDIDTAMTEEVIMTEGTTEDFGQAATTPEVSKLIHAGLI